MTVSPEPMDETLPEEPDRTLRELLTDVDTTTALAAKLYFSGRNHQRARADAQRANDRLRDYMKGKERE